MCETMHGSKLMILSDKLDALGRESCLSTSSPATAALDELLKVGSSSKRLKKSKQDTPSSRSSLINFSKGSSSSSKFDMTDLFHAAESENNKSNDALISADFEFPSLQWDLGDADEGPAGGSGAGVDGDDNSKCIKQQDCSDRNPFTSCLVGEATRRAKSASCLLGKRSRSGLVRSKTMRSEVDRLVNCFGDHHQAATLRL